MQLQVNFENPNDITKNAATPDTIFVTVKKSALFIDKNDVLLISLEHVATQDLPGQLTELQELERVDLEQQLDTTM